MHELSYRGDLYNAIIAHRPAWASSTEDGPDWQPHIRTMYAGKRMHGHGLTQAIARVSRILNRCGYPPDLQEEAVKTVLQQAELMCAEWTWLDSRLRQSVDRYGMTGLERSIIHYI